jgi:hypothetical protein
MMQFVGSMSDVQTQIQKVLLSMKRHAFPFIVKFLAINHRLNMELDLRSLFVLLLYSFTHWLRPRNSPPPLAFGLIYEGAYWSDKIDDISF